MTTILLTGFDPFGDDTRNPSGEAVRAVAARWERAETLVAEVLPVAFDAAGARMRELIVEHAPDVVIATGVSGGRRVITPERVAINVRDARIPDNSGAQPVDAPSIDGAPAAYFSTLPVKAIAATVDGAVSDTAGTFVCNHTMFVALHETAGTPGVRAGFIHVPWSHESAPANAPSLPLDEIVTALERAIAVTA